MFFFGVVLFFAPFVENTLKTELLTILRFLPHIQIVPTNLEYSTDFLKFFLKEQKVVPLFIGNQSYSENKIFTSKFDDSQESVTKFVELQSATYIHIIEDAIDRSSLEKYSRNIWDKKRITNLYFLTKIGLFSYNPFKNNGQLYSVMESDEKNIYQNLHGFPIRVQMFRSVYAVPVFNKTGSIRKVMGPDGKVAQTLKERMNFTMLFNEPNKDFFGYRLSNESFSGAIGEVITNQTDISLTGFFIKDYLTRNMDFTAAVYSDKLCCYVPKASRVPYSVLPLFSVHYSLWIGFIVSGFGVSLFWIVFRYLNIRFLPLKCVLKFTKNTMVRIVVDSWIVWVRVQLHKYPPFYSEKIFIVFRLVIVCRIHFKIIFYWLVRHPQMKKQFVVIFSDVSKFI
ncbi:hypothetical protein ACFFRR_002430 [Megaselia abdita]